MSGYVNVIGPIWWPVGEFCAQTIELTNHDIENMRGDDDGKIARCDIEDWLSTHAGDFQYASDFEAGIGNALYGWKDPESEWTFADCVYGGEE